MRENKVSSIVAIAVTVLAVVTAFTFSFASVAYQREVIQLKKLNIEQNKTIEKQQAVLKNIKDQLMSIGLKTQ